MKLLVMGFFVMLAFVVCGYYLLEHTHMSSVDNRRDCPVCTVIPRINLPAGVRCTEFEGVSNNEECLQLCSDAGVWSFSTTTANGKTNTNCDCK